MSAMTPLFCEKVVLGMEVNKPDRMELIPSARSPPWMEVSYSSPLVSNAELSKVAGIQEKGKKIEVEVSLCTNDYQSNRFHGVFFGTYQKCLQQFRWL